MRKFAMWLVDNVYLGKLAPYVFGFAIGKMPQKINNLNDINH